MTKVAQTKDRRAGLLERLFGSNDAEDKRDKLKKARDILDAAGVERKELSKELREKAVSLEETDVTELESVVIENVLAALATEDASTPDNIPTLVESAVMAAFEPLMSATTDTAGEDVPAEEMDAETEAVTESADEDADISRALVEHLQAQTKDNGELTDAIVQLVPAIKQALEGQAQVKELAADLDRIKKAMSQRPRAASSASETVTEADPDAHKEMSKTTTTPKKVLGATVKE